MASGRKFSEQTADLTNESRQERQKALLLTYQSRKLCESSVQLLSGTQKFAPKSALEKGTSRGGRRSKQAS